MLKDLIFPIFVWLAPRFQHHTHAAKVVQAFLFGSLEKELRAELAWPQPTCVGLAKGIELTIQFCRAL